jgi:hypothetical protein
LLVFVQLPWNWAFAIERRLVGEEGASAIKLEFDPAPGAASDVTGAAGTTSGEAAAALQAGRGSTRDVNQAVQYLRRRVRPQDAMAALELPVRAAGRAEDELLLADRTEIRLFGEQEGLLYRGDNAGALAFLLAPYPGGPEAPLGTMHQIMAIPGSTLRKAPREVRVRLDYSLTLMKLSAMHTLAALDGELQTDDVGRCATASDRNAVYLRCKTLAQAPFCYSATLIGPGERRNPEVLKCTPDYRRHMPAFRDVLGFYGVDMPLQDRSGRVYPLNASDVGASYVLFRIYKERAHFRRALEASGVEIRSWRPRGG